MASPRTVARVLQEKSNAMPSVKSGEAQIYYELEGPSGAPVLVFSNSLGTNHLLWDPQISKFKWKWRVLHYDSRGHGSSSSTPGPYSVELLAKDVLALLDALELDPVIFFG